MGKLAQGVVIAIAMLVSATAFGQSNAPMPAQTASAPGQFTDQDRAFVDKAAIRGMFEVQAGHLAAKSSDSQVRNFASRMVQDHSAAGDELKRIVDAKGISLPDALDDKHQQLLTKLGALDGAAFDREYVQEMVDDHDEDARAFAEAGRTLNDPELKAFAEKTLTVVESHDRMAHEIAGKMAEK